MEEWQKYFPHPAEKDPDPAHDEAYFASLQEDLIATSLQLALRTIREYDEVYGSDPGWYVDQEMGRHERRVSRIKLYVWQRKTGLPF